MPTAMPRPRAASTASSGSAPMTARRRAVIGADPDEAVDAALGLGIAVGILAFDEQGRRLDAGLLAGMAVDELDLHAVALGPTRVHALEHARPVVRLGA